MISLRKWKLIERKYALRSITKKKLNVPEKPKLKCLDFTYNGAKLFNMLPIKMKKMDDKGLDMGKYTFILIIINYLLLKC